MLENLSVGLVDWQRADLVDNYFPEGLPEDWRADFYFNDFRVVLVEQKDWMAWSDEFLEELLFARRDESAIYFKLEQADKDSLTKLASLKAELGDWLVGVLCLVEVELDLEGLRVTYFASEFSGDGWQWNNGAGVLFGDPLGWVEDLTGDAKEQRALLESFVASLAGEKPALPFFVGGESIKMAQLKQFQTLAELLGF